MSTITSERLFYIMDAMAEESKRSAEAIDMIINGSESKRNTDEDYV